MTQEMKAAVTEELGGSTTAVGQPVSVVTRMTFAAPPARVWQDLVFYEAIDEPPPFHLRLLLPVPIGTEGEVSDVGDEATCLYEGGHLLKRITRIERDDLYEFEVAEQALAVGGGMRLSGGRYTLRELADGLTEVAVETRYTSTKWPRWFWRPLERLVCHWFHRYLLGRCDARSSRRERRREVDMPELMPPDWLIRIAVAAVWLYEGLWCKLLRGEPREFEVVKAVPRYGPRFGVPFLMTLGAVEVTWPCGS